MFLSMTYKRAFWCAPVLLLLLCCGNPPLIPEQPEEPKTIGLLIDSLAWEKLCDKQQRALAKGVLISKKKDWVNARLVVGEDTLLAQVRLKGDWTDHLKGEKWSFRVRLLNGKLWKGMSVFSLQAPETRYFLHEWVTHKLFEDQGILTPQYGIIRLRVNDSIKGIYAYEEHFTPELGARSGRRKGLLLKYDEDVLWDIRAKHNKRDFAYLPTFESAEIESFDKQLFKSKELCRQFNRAQHLLHHYRFGSLPAEEIFNPERLARFMAVMDLTGGYHTLIWHNQRFFYDPRSRNIEPIGFDCFTNHGPYDWIKRPYMGHDFRPNLQRPDRPAYVYNLLRSAVVHENYLVAVTELADAEYVLLFEESIAEELSYWTAKLENEYPDYEYDSLWLVRNASNIRSAMDTSSFNADEMPEVRLELERNLYKHPDSLILPKKNLAVKAYWFNDTLWLVNYYINSTRVTAIGDSMLKKPIILEAYPKKYLPKFVALPHAPAKRVYFQISGSDSLFNSKVKRKPHPF